MHFSKNDVKFKYLSNNQRPKKEILGCIFDTIFILIIQYLKNVISIVIEHNRDLQWWFEDIGKTLLSLIADVRDCATLSGSERMFVFFFEDFC